MQDYKEFAYVAISDTLGQAILTLKDSEGKVTIEGDINKGLNLFIKFKLETLKSDIERICDMEASIKGKKIDQSVYDFINSIDEKIVEKLKSLKLMSDAEKQKSLEANE